MSYRLIEQLQQKTMPVKQMCHVLEVSRSGYCAALRRTQRPAAVSKTTKVLADNLTALLNRAVPIVSGARLRHRWAA